MDRFTVYKTDKGRYAVRPIDWAGIWDKDWNIKENGINHTAIFAEKEDAEFFAMTKNAEEQGKMLILPCKPGDTVYAYCEELHRILPYFVEQVVVDYDSDNPDGYITINANCVEDMELIDSIDFEPKEVGEIVFLTEQEAKEALEGIQHEKA